MIVSTGLDTVSVHWPALELALVAPYGCPAAWLIGGRLLRLVIWGRA